MAGFPEQPVVPDAGGEGEYSLADACPDALRDVAAVVLEGELALERVVDRLDPLADPAELAEAWLLVLAVGADELRIKRGDDPLELLAGEALVGDDDLLAGEQPFAARWRRISWRRTASIVRPTILVGSTSKSAEGGSIPFTIGTFAVL